MKLYLKNDWRGNYLVRDDGRFYGRVASSNRKMGGDKLLAIIKQQINRYGFYDPDDPEKTQRPQEDVS